MSLPELKESHISWDECFMRISEVIAQRSKDPSTKNGAVVVNDKKIVVGLGYNGFPRGVDDAQLPWAREGEFCDTKYAYVVHAEENAIYNSNAQTDGCVLYCTLFPCNECAKTIIQSGIKEVIFQSDKYHDQDVWKASRKLFDLAGVKYRQYETQWTEPDKSCKTEKISSKIKVKKIHPKAKTPMYAHPGDAGMDLFAVEGATIAPGERIKVGTGITMEIPQGQVGLIWDKSGIATKLGLKVIGGVIDSGYRGEIIIGILNISQEQVDLRQGEKIAQMLIQPIVASEFEEVDELSDTARGGNGFGSTGHGIDPIEEIKDSENKTEEEDEFRAGRW